MKDLLPLLRVLFGAIIRAILPAVFEAAREANRDTAEDALPQPELRNRLQNRIRAKWGRAGTVGALALCALLLASGCGGGTHALFVSEGQPVRLRETIKKAPVWVMGADGRPVAAVMDLSAGLFVLSDPGVDEPETSPEAAGPTTPSTPGVTVPPEIPSVYATPAPAPTPLNAITPR